MPVRLFVGNLSYDATEAELRQHFGTIGPVSYCYLPTDRETGRPRGFAFIEYAADALAQEAITRLNNQSFRGRPLAVKEAQPREARPPGAGPTGGRPSFGGPRPGGPGGPRPPMGGGPAPFDSGAPRQRRESVGNFGPDAPPRGKKGKFKASEPRGPKGPIRVKPNGRIYSTDEYGEEEPAESVDLDNFATRAEGDKDEDAGADNVVASAETSTDEDASEE